MNDLISRKALLKRFKNQCQSNCEKCDYFTFLASDNYCGLIDETPSVEAVPVVHGEWIEIEPKGYREIDCYNITPRYKCSHCNKEAIKVGQNYRGHGESVAEYTWFNTTFCPNCGAKMKTRYNK